MPAPAPRPPGGRPLVGDTVRLDPLVPGDAEDLYAALADPAVWRAGFAGGPAAQPGTVEQLRTLVAGWTRAAGHAAYTVRLSAGTGLGERGTVVGTTSLGEVDLANGGVHLGWTAYGPRWWGTSVNPEAKLLLLRHAFEDCGFERVQLQTDVVNLRSQAAIAGLGAVREGVLRHHRRRADGSWRDTVVFSVIAADWPGVRDRLGRRLAARPEARSGPPAAPTSDPAAPGRLDPGLEPRGGAQPVHQRAHPTLHRPLGDAGLPGDRGV